MKILLALIAPALLFAMFFGIQWLTGMETNKSSVEINAGAVKLKVEAAKPTIEAAAAVDKRDPAITSAEPVKPTGAESKATEPTQILCV
jgi:hypothetical protein